MKPSIAIDRAAANRHLQSISQAFDPPGSATVTLRQDARGDIDAVTMVLSPNLVAMVELVPRSFGAAFVLVINPGTLNSETDQWTMGPEPCATIAEVGAGQTLGMLVLQKIARYRERV